MTKRGVAVALAISLAALLTGCQVGGGAEPVPTTTEKGTNEVSLTLEEAKARSVEIAQQALAEVDTAALAPVESQPPTPGTVPAKLLSLSCADGDYAYHGGGAALLLPGTDANVHADRVHELMAEKAGWRPAATDAGDEDTRRLDHEDGFTLLVGVIRPGGDEPKVTVTVWSPCFTPPADFNPHKQY